MDMLEETIQLMLNSGSDEWQKAFCQLPGLMNEEVLDLLKSTTQDMLAEIQERVTDYITVAHHIEEQMRSIPKGYPLGEGPIEQLFLRKKQGHMGMDVAKEQVREMALNKMLHPSYLTALSFRCVQLSYQGEPEDALDIQALLHEAAEIILDGTQHGIQVKLAAEYIRSASWFLGEKGNARIYHEAVSIGKQGLSHAKTDEERAELHYVLGILHLDPYAAQRTPDWYTIGIRQWFVAGENPSDCELGSEDGLPRPENALAEAELQLRSAYQMSQGKMRRDSLKALVQTLESGRVIDRNPDDNELVELCDEALGLLEKYPSPEQQRYVSAVRNKTADNLNLASSETANHLQVEPLDDMLKNIGGVAAIDAWVTAIGLLVNRKPKEVLRLSLAERNLFMHYATEVLKEALWRHELTAMSLLANQHANDDERLPGSLRIWQAVKSSLAATRDNSELAAHEELLATIKQYPDAAQQHYNALLWLVASLELGTGANAFNYGDIESAAKNYFIALLRFTDLQLVKISCEILDRLHQIISNAEGDSLLLINTGLNDIGVRLDCLLGARAQQVTNPIAVSLIKRLVDTHERLLELIWAMEFSKGRVFRALLRQSKTSTFIPSAEIIYTLNDIIDLENKIISDNSEGKALPNESVLGAFYTESVSTAGNDMSSQLRNLRHTFDESVTHERLLQIVQQQAYITKEDTITNMLPGTTVLLDMYKAGRINVTLAYTSEGVTGFVVDDKTDLGGAYIEITDDTMSATFRSSALTVEMLRNHICAEPGPFDVDRKARPFLDSSIRHMLGHGVEQLQKWFDMGKRHLCFVPHGAHHFLPIHLMTWNGKPLAEQWVVTYLPNISLLTDHVTEGDTSNRRSAGYAALGLDYQNHPYLPTINNSIHEVKAVAKSMDVIPILNDDVTKTLVKQTLSECSRIHISCHGKIHSESPELQHLYLAKNQDAEEKLYAYELSELDLQHVDLISLSACESGLGRFDEGDNLRGIQANLFISGVSTIVDTLWDVSESAAETFFTTFYKQLSNGENMLNAFRNSQIATREVHRAYRDWGAFRLSGKW